jgi:hypothetical protein
MSKMLEKALGRISLFVKGVGTNMEIAVLHVQFVRKVMIGIINGKLNS